MRCFIAIDIDEPTRTAIEHLQKELASKVDIKKSDVKWVNSTNIHLTLKFLGEIKDKQVVQACDITKEVAARHTGFDIDIEKVGCFGGRTARVVWVGTGQGSDKLSELQKDLDQQLTQAGFAEENRAFWAHLTLCRIRNPKAGIKLAQLVEDYTDYKLSTISADAILVYQSQLTPQGPIYTLLAEHSLLITNSQTYGDCGNGKS